MMSSKLGRSNSDLQTSRYIYPKHNFPQQRSHLPPPHHPKPPQTKVPVLYYLSVNGHLQHPHFIEVPLSSDSLYLRDVINRLNTLRGKAMPSMYSWSSKRSYKNGFVWQDLAEDDLIYPAQGQEYILKGSELLLEPSLDPDFGEPVNSPPEIHKSGGTTEFPLLARRRNQSWSGIDLNEYKVYKTDCIGESIGKAAADASTQTEEMRHRRRAITELEHKRDGKNVVHQIIQNQTTELSREEISPPPSESSEETLESLMKADGKIIKIAAGDRRDDLTVNNHPSGRMKASTVLMQLLTCGSIGFKDCGPGSTKEHPGLTLVAQYKPRLPRGRGEGIEDEVTVNKRQGNKGKVVLEDKEYFSGSLIQETNRDEFPALKRSSSYNADRSIQMEVKDKEGKEGGTSGKGIAWRPNS